MSKSRCKKTIAFVVSLFVALFLGGCETLSLAPQGPAAAEIARIWWILFWTALVVSVIVFALLFVALWRSRRSDVKQWRQGRDTAFVLVGGGIIPAVILIGATILTFSGLAVFAEPRNATNLAITVTGHMFWWEATYEGQDFTTANEIHIPVGQPVRINLESADVIHSFWVPQLHGKIEMIPGWTNVIYLEADEPGVYFGKCAEFCGVQHANMEFLVIAQEEDDFQGWLEQQRRSAAQPEDDLTRKGQQVFLGSACVYCHTIRGTNASGRLGPDLTHLASRRTIGARMLENNHGNLAGWTVNSQAIKPGNRMPPMQLEPESLQALLVYLESLE